MYVQGLPGLGEQFTHKSELPDTCFAENLGLEICSRGVRMYVHIYRTTALVFFSFFFFFLQLKKREENPAVLCTYSTYCRFKSWHMQLQLPSEVGGPVPVLSPLLSQVRRMLWCFVYTKPEYVCTHQPSLASPRFLFPFSPTPT